VIFSQRMRQSNAYAPGTGGIRPNPLCCFNALASLIPPTPFLSSVEFLGEMSDVLHSRAPLPLIPPAPFSHKGRRGRCGVLMAETGDGTQGLAKESTPVSNPLLPQGEKGEVWRPDPQFRTALAGTQRQIGRRGRRGVLMLKTGAARVCRKNLPWKVLNNPTPNGIRRYCVTACATKSMVNTTSSLTFATNGTLGIWRL